MRLNDRLFDVGDIILLRETKYSCEEMSEGKPLDYTGRVLSRIINNIFIGGEYGLKENWVILTVSKI